MKTNFIKKFMLLTTAFAVAFGMVATSAFASGASINSASNDLKTVRVSNYSAVPGSMTWGSTVNSAAGQIVSVGIYYHNSGDQTLQNLKVRLSPQTSGATSSHTFTATLSADNAPSVVDSATVSVVGDLQSLSYIPTAVYWYPNQACKNNPSCQPTTLPLGQSGAELFNGGLSLGNIAPGWSTQGGLTVQFQVSNNSAVGVPTVTTNDPTGISANTGSVTLRGYVDPKGTTVSAWFKYRRHGGSWIETPHQSISSAQSVSRSLSGLDLGNYEYQAVVNTDYTGGSKYFIIDNCDSLNNCGGDTGSPSVDTLYATGVDTNSATLRGRLTDNGNDSNDLYFKWGTSSSNLNHTLNAGSQSSTGTFSEDLSGLHSDTTYYFRACASNGSGSDCGGIESFDTDSGNSCDTCNCTNGCLNDRATVTTLNALSVGSTSAVANGYYNANGCSVTTYFQYGRTNSLGSTTSSVSHGNTSGGMAYAFLDLSANTTYYFRAVAENCNGTSYGVTKSFTTTSQGTGPGPVVITDSGNGGGNAFIKLMIDNHRQTIHSGTDVPYDVSWENVTGSTLKNLIIQVNFDQMIVTDTDMGNIAHDGKSVIVEVPTLGSHETGEMTVTTKTTGSLKDGDPIVAQAIVAFENPKTSATENAIAYDSDQFSTRGSTLGASIFGLGFLPTSLGGWLIIILIILLIIVLARHYVRQNQPHVVVTNQAPHPVDATPTTSAGNDYIVYRPTPKV